MTGRILTARVVLPAAMVMLIAGCGGGSTKPRGGKDNADKKIKDAEKSAARSCVLEYTREALKVRESALSDLRGSLSAAETEVSKLMGDLEAFAPDEGGVEKNVDPVRLEELNRQLKAAQDKVSRLGPELAPKLRPLEVAIKRLNELRDRMSSAGAREGLGVCSLVSHEVEPLSPKAPNQRTSKMKLKPEAFVDVLGKDPLEFRLTWRRVVRSNKYTARNPKVSYELSRVDLLSGGIRYQKPVPVKSTDVVPIEEEME